MPPEPVPADPGWDEDLTWLDRDPERETWLDRAREHDEPPLEEEYADHEPLTEQELAEIRDAAADELLAVEAATIGRRGPGQPGSARVFPGESASPAAAFGPGMVFDVLPGCAQLAVAADAAVADDRFAGISEAELVGVMCAWDRVEAHAAARKLAVIAELDRRNPEPEDAEFTADEIANALGESRFRADELMGMAGHLATHLPGTAAALADGTVSLGKARIIANATALMDPDEAAAAENEVLDRAGRLTPGSLRAAIARAVMEVAPDKARKRREVAAKFARVERWAEDSGNAALAGRELPPDEVLAIDDRITARARELKNAGLDGGTDEIRARAYLDLLLGRDSRPGASRPADARPGTSGLAPGGFAGRVTLTVPLATLSGLADRPGELAGLGPVDPWLARDLATRRRSQPQDHVVPYRHRQPGTRHRPRLRPARTQEPPQTRRPWAAGVLLHPGQPGRPARERIWHLAAAYPARWAGPDRHRRLPHHRPVRPPPPGQRPRPRGQAPAPVPGPARHLHQPRLPAPRRPVRPRAQHPLRSRRPHLSL